MHRLLNWRRRSENGASAVEFALVVTVMAPLMLGIIDYGLWFNDSLNVRQGVREAARLGVVQRDVTCDGAPASGLADIPCNAKKQIGAVSGPAYARVEVPTGWAKGKPLVVCALVRADAVTGFTPFPSKFMRSKTQLSIEVATPVPTGATVGTATEAGDPAPTGATWDWC